MGIELGYCSLTAIRATFEANSPPGAKTRSSPVAGEHHSKFPAKIAKRGPIGYANSVQLSVAAGVGAQQPQEERERLWSSGSACEGTRHLPNTITHQSR